MAETAPFVVQLLYKNMNDLEKNLQGSDAEEINKQLIGPDDSNLYGVEGTIGIEDSKDLIGAQDMLSKEVSVEMTVGGEGQERIVLPRKLQEGWAREWGTDAGQSLAVEEMDDHMKAIYLNAAIKASEVNTNLIGDEYHTIGELYEHRIQNFITLCKALTMDDNGNYRRAKNHLIWRTQVEDGWFVLGINREVGKQITYHLPESKYEEVKNIALLMEPLGEKFDGHTGSDVLERLKNLW